jgi:hypothetical protein
VAAIAEAGFLDPSADTPVCHDEAVLGSGVQLLPTAPDPVAVEAAPEGLEVATATPATQAMAATIEMMARRGERMASPAFNADEDETGCRCLTPA